MRCQTFHRHTVLQVLLRHCAPVIIVSLFVFKGAAMAEPPVDFYNLLPPDVDAWKKTGPPEVFDNQTLFQYINGGAELYISYGFKKLTALRYERAKGDEIKVDVFDMGSSYNAYGVFSHGRESPGAELGQGSEYAAGFLNFWKDRYYISLLGYPESAETRRVLFTLGQALDRCIVRQGPVPPVVSALPSAGLIPASIRYARHYLWLNNHYFISNDNILLIDRQTEAALAKYGSPDGKHVLLLIKHTGPRKAQDAEASFLKHYLPDARAGIRQQNNGRFAGIARSGACLAVVLGAPDKKTVEQALAQAIKNAAGL